MGYLRLFFSEDPTVELQRTVFYHVILERELCSVRGKTSGAYPGQGTFQWTTAVQGLAVFALRAATYSSNLSSKVTLPLLEGGSDTFAASLDYALSKQPLWLIDIFGVDSQGNSLARRVFKRSNPERKRAGPVSLTLNTSFLEPDKIEIFLNNERITKVEELDRLANLIESGQRYLTSEIISRPTVLKISKAALSENLENIINLVAPAKVMAVVKANAYGHGLVECAKTFERAGAHQLGVAFVEEGIMLRRAGVGIPILVFGGVLQSQVRHFLEFDLDITGLSVSKLDQINDIAQQHQKKARVHLKIDTGMERLGQHSYTANKLFEKALSCAWIDVVGLESHFASAENRDLSFAKLQLERFNEAARFFEARSLPMPLRHMANSAALHRMEESWLDMVRPGLCLYGVLPCHPDITLVRNAPKLKPALTLHSQVVYFKVIPNGAGVSYEHTWLAAEQTRIITIPIGYGDGYSRQISNRGRVLIRGNLYPIVGSICMDQLMVDIGPNGEAFNGDEVILIGSQKKQSISVSDVSEWGMTIPHDILVSLNQRLPRIYI